MRVTQRSERVVAGVLVGAACLAQLAVMGLATAGLALVLVACYALWLGRAEWRPADAILPPYVAAFLVQCVHLVEEYQTGFYVRFPPLFGAPAWSPARFLAFNVAWLAVFAAAGVAMRRGKRLSYLAALFLALGGGVANGLAHLGLTALRGAYFPGAYTGAVALVAGGALAWRLLSPDSPDVRAPREPRA